MKKEEEGESQKQGTLQTYIPSQLSALFCWPSLFLYFFHEAIPFQSGWITEYLIQNQPDRIQYLRWTHKRGERETTERNNGTPTEHIEESWDQIA